jgi:hypothetical protein
MSSDFLNPQMVFSLQYLSKYTKYTNITGGGKTHTHKKLYD